MVARGAVGRGYDPGLVRRVARNLLNVATVLSALLCGGAAGLWAMSYRADVFAG